MLTEIALLILGIWVFVYIVERMERNSRTAAIILSFIAVVVKLVWEFLAWGMQSGGGVIG